MPTETFPQYYVLKVPGSREEDGGFYVVCEALTAVREAALPDPVKSALGEEFKKAAALKPIKVAELPDSGADYYGRGWLWMQLSNPKKPPPPPPPIASIVNPTDDGPSEGGIDGGPGGDSPAGGGGGSG